MLSVVLAAGGRRCPGLDDICGNTASTPTRLASRTHNQFDYRSSNIPTQIKMFFPSFLINKFGEKISESNYNLWPQLRLSFI